MRVAVKPHSRSAAGRMPSAPFEKIPSADLAGGNVLIDPKEVVRVVAPLQLPETRVLLGAVGLADAILPLVAEEVHVDALLVRFERRPEVPHPLPLLAEAVGGLGTGADVVREAGVAAAER